MKHHVMHLTRKDFEWSYFKVGGAGGQHRDKTDAGVRCFHRPSGAEGRASDSRSQATNRKTAFRKCAESEKFRAWVQIETSRQAGDIDRAVKDALRKENVLIEYGPFD